MPQFDQVYFDQAVFDTVLVPDSAGGTFTVDGLPQLPGDYVLIGNLRTDRGSTNDEVDVEYDGDTTDGNYRVQILTGASTSVSASSDNTKFTTQCPGDNVVANAFGPYIHIISNPADGTNDPHALTLGGYHGTSDASFVTLTSRRRNNVAAVTKVKVLPGIGTNFKIGSMLSAYHVPKNTIASETVETAKASITLTIPSGYRDFIIKFDGRTTEAAARSGLDIQLNTDTTAANYDGQQLSGDGNTAAAAPKANDRTLYGIPGANATANVFGGGQTTVFGYTKTDRFKHLLSISGAAEDIVELNSMDWKSTDAITQVVLTISGGADFAVGSRAVIEGIGKTAIGWEDQYLIPEVTVEIDWGNTNRFDGANDDVTGDTTGVQWTRGRNSAVALTSQASPGRARITLLNDDELYSPLGTSAIAGQIIPGRKVRIRQTSPQAQTMWQGFISGIQNRQRVDGFHTAVLSCVGALNQVQRSDVNSAQQLNVKTGTIISTLLDDADWDSTARTIDDGQTTITRYWTGQKSALSAIREVEATEAGYVGEDKSGRIVFEDRDHRLKAPHTDSQATFSDTDDVSVIRYSGIQQADPNQLIYNDLRASVIVYSTGTANSVLWKHPEATVAAGAPPIPAGGSLVYWASFPNILDGFNSDQPDELLGVSVATWVLPVATTDWQVSTTPTSSATVINGSVSVVHSGFANSQKVTLTNTGTIDGFLTFAQSRGTAILQSDPVTVQALDASSTATFGLRSFPRPDRAKFVPNTVEAQDWADLNLGIWKSPQAFVNLSVIANRNLYTMVDTVRLDVSDRVTISGTGAGGLGITGDYFIESEQHTITADRRHSVTWSVSPAGGMSAGWVMGKSRLGTDTVVRY